MLTKVTVSIATSDGGFKEKVRWLSLKIPKLKTTTKISKIKYK